MAGLPPALITGTHLYTWVERGTVRVKCARAQHNVPSQAEPRPIDLKFSLLIIASVHANGEMYQLIHKTLLLMQSLLTLAFSNVNNV